jgi:sporulation protein YlmC with PRC-barrel domain
LEYCVAGARHCYAACCVEPSEALQILPNNSKATRAGAWGDETVAIILFKTLCHDLSGFIRLEAGSDVTNPDTNPAGHAPRATTEESFMERKILTSIVAVSVLLSVTNTSFAQQVVGSTQLGVAYAELRSIATGWSVRRQVLGRTVYNDNGEAIGKVDDIIVGPDKAISYAIIGAGGFLGIGKHDVAIPVSQMKENNGKFVLAGATKDALKAMPPFEYAN